LSSMVNKFRIFIKKLRNTVHIAFILLTAKYLKQFVMKELRAIY
jgi:hypothetical protein